MSNFNRKGRLASGISATAIALTLCIAQPAMAQSTSGITGHVDNAAAGATVVAVDTVTGERATGTVGASGEYRIVGVRPSTYRVEAGGKTQDVVVPVGQTVTVDFLAETAAPNERAIIVTGRRTREVKTATVHTNVSQEQIQNLPQNDRNFMNFAALAPGVTVSPSSGNRTIQAGGVSADNINVFIDGTSFKNQVGHGGVAGQSFSQGNPFPQLAVQEFAVDTQNFKAEYDQAGSAIITAVTKTGGTSFHGDVFGEWQPKSFIGRPFFDRPGEANNPNGDRKKPDYNRLQYGADLGGPIIPDKLHFYIAYEGTKQTNPSTSVLLQPPVPANIISAENGSFGANFKQGLLFGKLTFFATPDDTVNATYFNRHENDIADFGDRAAQSHGHDKQNDIRNYQIEWRHRGEDFLNEATVAYQTVDTGTPRLTEGPDIRLHNGVFGPELALLGAHFFVQTSGQKLLTFRDNATFIRGSHTIKAGVKLTKAKLSRLEDWFGNGTYFFDANTYTGFLTSVPYAAQIAINPPQTSKANDKQIGLFLQDDWAVTDKLLVNLGLRWDYESNANNNKFVTPQRIADALRAYPGWQAAGIDPEDYITDGNDRKPYKRAFSPRLGISYDVKGDRDLILFAGAGRYYDRNLFLTSQIETVVDLYRTDTFITFGGGTPCSPIFTPALLDPAALQAALSACTQGGSVWLNKDKTKLPYSDQFNVGVRKRFGDIQTSVTLSHIRSHNIFQYVRGNRYSNGWFSRVLQRDGAGNVIGCTDGGPLFIVDNFPTTDYAACPAKQGNLAGFVGKLNIGANGGKANYNAIYITAEKPFVRNSRWGFSASLTLQRARTNVGTELGADEFFEGPYQDQFGWNYVQGVPKWNFVGTGITRLPWDFIFSGTLSMNSGPSFGDITFGVPNTPENGCCIANLGGVHYPKKTIAYKTLDVRLAKSFKTPWGHELTADFQVYNVFDWVNRSYSSWGSGGHGFGSDPSFKENGTVGNARSFQAGLRYSF